MTNITEVKFTPCNQDALQSAETLIEFIKKHESATELFALVRVGTDYYRFCTHQKDMMALVSFLEFAKFDCFKRMSGENNDDER